MTRPLFGAVLVCLVVVAYLAAALPSPWHFIAAGAVVVCVLALSAFLNRAQSTPHQNESGPTPPAMPEDIQPAQHDLQEVPELTEVIDALPVGVMVIGDDGKITAFNQAAGEIFGVAAARAANRSLIEIVRNFELDKRVSATLREGAQDSAELAYSSAQERSLQVMTRPLPSNNGSRRALVIVTDQTRMRDLEALRREFVSNVSHELRTPLTAVKLMVETLQTGVERPASDEFLASIALETERMIALVEDLLDLARLESGKLELRLGSVDVGELCRQAAQAQRAQAQSLGIELDCSTIHEPITISADHDKLFQVLVNLLDNALRHTPSGGRVTIVADRVDGAATIRVSDTGSGIPSTALPHIFERFYVVDPARARSRSGTGLGLAIVKHIIEAHGGTIAAESELGVGTTFTCRLQGLQS